MESESLDVVVLPIGVVKEGVRYRKVVIDEMTGRDEELLADPKFKQQPGRAITVMLQRIIQEIPGVFEAKKNPMTLAPKDIVRKMYAADRDAILIGLRRLSFGNTMQVAWACGKCAAHNADDVDLSELKRVDWDEDAECSIDFTLPRGIDFEGKRLKNGSMRFPTGVDSEAVAKRAKTDPGGATTALLATVIEQVDGEHIDATMVQRMATRDRLHLGEVFQQSLPGVRMRADLYCPECGNLSEGQPLDMGDFFSLT